LPLLHFSLQSYYHAYNLLPHTTAEALIAKEQGRQAGFISREKKQWKGSPYEWRYQYSIALNKELKLEKNKGYNFLFLATPKKLCAHKRKGLNSCGFELLSLAILVESRLKIYKKGGYREQTASRISS
jgi:hypothetical protein